MNPSPTLPALLFVLAVVLLTAACESPADNPAPVSDTTMPPFQVKVPVSHVTSTIPPATGITEKTDAIPEIPATGITDTFAAGTSIPPASNHPEYIRMDADFYNAGDIVEFYLVNRGDEIKGCDHAQPAFSVYQIFQDGTRRKVAGNIPGIIYRATMTDEPSTATGPLTFNSAGMLPGRYLIRFDCGDNVAREFVIYAKVHVTET